MVRFRLLALFLIGFCQFSFGQSRQVDGQQVGKSDDFGAASAAAGDPNNLWQGPTVPPVTRVSCSPNCDPSKMKRSDSPTRPDANSPKPSEQVSQSSQQPLTPALRQAGELSDAAQRAADVGDWAGAMKAIKAAVSLSPDDQQLRQQENIILKLVPKDLKDKLNMGNVGRQAQNLTSSPQTDSLLAAPQGLPQADQGFNLGQIVP